MALGLSGKRGANILCSFQNQAPSCNARYLCYVNLERTRSAFNSSYCIVG